MKRADPKNPESSVVAITFRVSISDLGGERNARSWVPLAMLVETLLTSLRGAVDNAKLRAECWLCTY